MDKPNEKNKKIIWNAEEQAQIDKALREAALAAEIEKQLREQIWSAPSSKK